MVRFYWSVFMVPFYWSVFMVPFYWSYTVFVFLQELDIILRNRAPIVEKEYANYFHDE